MTSCDYRSSYSDSGDRGADMAHHNRVAHPDHEHVWGDSPYEWEAAGTSYIIPGTPNQRAVRDFPPQRCTVCAMRPIDMERCGPCERCGGPKCDGWECMVDDFAPEPYVEVWGEDYNSDSYIAYLNR